MPGQASPFSQDQRIWIVEKFFIEGSINQFVYKELLEEKVGPLIKHRATRGQLYLMQDEQLAILLY